MNYKQYIIFFICCILVTNVQAQDTKKQFSFSIKQKELKEIIKTIEKESDYSFVYNEHIDLSVKKDLEIKNKTIQEVLSSLFRKTVIDWKISEKHIILQNKKENESSRNEAGFGTPQTLREVTIISESKAKQLVKSSQMGSLALSQADIKNIPTLFGEADIIKAIQTQPGVSAGTEGLAGMYVRGGSGDDNLFILDGTQLYQANHIGGLFSVFNAEAIQDAAFYKSSFPARYGGRLSSVLDIRTREGELSEYHGSLMLGLTSGNLNINGPIIKNKTGFNLSLRRSWFDALTIPGLKIINKINSPKGEKTIGGYAFTDLNLNVNHLINEENKIYLNAYYGNDKLTFGQEYFSPNNTVDFFKNRNETKLKWGNTLFSAGWKSRLQSNLYLNLQAYHMRYASDINYSIFNEIKEEGSENIQQTIGKSSTENGINDSGIRLHFEFYPHADHRLNFGTNYIYHRFRPEYNKAYTLKDEVEWKSDNKKEQTLANELGIYVEDDWNVSSRLSLNAGLRFGMFFIENNQHKTLEPRISSRFLLSPDLSVKASYSRMYQYIQQISNNYISLPSDYWMPIFGEFKPLKSDQISAGIYYNLKNAFSFSAEGYYKKMENLLEYKDEYNYFSTAASWKERLTAGKGRSYGADFMITKETDRLTGYLGYGLMWANRQFEELNQGKVFPSKYDNRHKINLVLNYKLSERTELNASWTFMSGNRVSLAFDQYQDLEDAGFPPELYPNYPYKDQVGLSYYEGKNNYQLPSYHRLDLGLNFYRPKSNGRMGIWNISIYNAYSRMNPIAVTKSNDYSQQKDGSWEQKTIFKLVSIFPTVPSVSYTYKF